MLIRDIGLQEYSREWYNEDYENLSEIRQRKMRRLLKLEERGGTI